MKFAGFLTGAGLAAIGVFAWSTYTHVSDQDRFVTVIEDHCLPYIRTGATPFENLGRPLGVYDQASLSENISNGGVAILYDNRFVAEWGESTDQNSAVRVCFVKDSYAQANSVGFEVTPVFASDWVEENVTAGTDLIATGADPTDAPSMLIWEAPPEAERSTGLRVILIVTASSVSSVGLVDDFDG